MNALRGRWYSDAEVLAIKTKAFENAARYYEVLEREVAELVAEARRLQEELDEVRSETLG